MSLRFDSPLHRRHFLKATAAGGATFVFNHMDVAAQAKSGIDELPRTSPHSEGISEKHIKGFIDAMSRDGHELHSLMILRRGKVIAEAWAEPYGPNINHAMYSLSKSFTSTGVGFAIGEGLVKVSDKVISFFPDDLPKEVSKNLADLEVRHLLTMSAGMDNTASSVTANSENWVRTFLAQPMLHQPGTVFNYNTAATYMLSAIVQKVSGEKLIDYLKPRLLDRIGIVGVTWDECPAGISKGGFGLNINTEGLARFGQLYLQRGQWNGERILSEEWIEAATSKQIQQGTDGNKNPDWLQGYGYQFWRCRHDCYRGDGAFGQFTIVIPEKEVVIAMSSESASMQGELDLVWEHLLPNFGDNPVPASSDKIALHPMSFPVGKAVSPMSEEWSGKTIRFGENPIGIDSITFDFSGDTLKVAAKSQSKGDWKVESGSDQWIRGEMPVAMSNSWLVSKGKTDDRGFSKVATAYAWTDEHSLEMVWRYYETPHHDVIHVEFAESEVILKLHDSNAIRRGKSDKPKTILKGTLA